MLRNNKAKDDLACDPKAIVVFKKKGLQDPRDSELAVTCQSTEVLLLLPNTAGCTAVGELHPSRLGSWSWGPWRGKGIPWRGNEV